MLPHTQEFADALTGGNAQVVVRGRAQRDFQTIIGDVPLVNPIVTINETASSRRSLQCSVADSDGSLRPQIGSDPLSPYGAELVVECGLRIPNVAEPEMKILGVFRLQVTDTGPGNVTVTGLDRSAVIANARFEEPYVIAAGTPLDVAWGDLIQSRYPGIPMVIDPDAQYETVASTIVYGEGSQDGDPWQNSRTLAGNFARESVVIPDGSAALRKIIDPSLQPITWEFTPGEANLSFDPHEILDPTALYNVWIVEASGSGIAIPVRATAEITDPADPMYPGPGGPGRRPTWYTSPYLTTTDQCAAAAEGFRLKQQGATAALTFSAVGNPCHEEGDVVRFESTDLGVARLVALSRWTIAADLIGTTTYTSRAVT